MQVNLRHIHRFSSFRFPPFEDSRIHFYLNKRSKLVLVLYHCHMLIWHRKLHAQADFCNCSQSINEKIYRIRDCKMNLQPISSANYYLV